MAKKQTRRSISVSRTTYERLKAFCEANSISMSQIVETRVNDFLGEGVTVSASVFASVPASVPAPVPASVSIPGSSPPRPVAPVPAAPRPVAAVPVATPRREPEVPRMGAIPAPAVPMTSAAARYAVDPPPPIIKPRQETVAPKPAEKRPDQIFTF
jgi:hypothetical protein